MSKLLFLKIWKAGPNSPTRGLCQLLENILSPFAQKLKIFVKEDRDFLSRVPRFVDYERDLISCDIVSLYTEISHDPCLKTLDIG